MTGLLPCSAASAAPISCHDRASSKCNNNAPVRSRACFCSPTRTYSFSDTAPLWRDDLPSERRRASDFELALARAQGAATNGSTDDWETVATISETRAGTVRDALLRREQARAVIELAGLGKRAAKEIVERR